MLNYLLQAKVVFYQEWLRREINKRLKSEVEGRLITRGKFYYICLNPYLSILYCQTLKTRHLNAMLS